MMEKQMPARDIASGRGGGHREFASIFKRCQAHSLLDSAVIPRSYFAQTHHVRSGTALGSSFSFPFGQRRLCSASGRGFCRT